MKKLTHSKKNIFSIFCSERVIVTISILFLLVLGIFLHDDFGIHWDSEQQQRMGRLNTSYILDRNESFYTYNNRYHGPLFEILLFIITKDMPEQKIYFTRHLVTYLFFLLGVVAFYFLNQRIIKKWPLALLCCAMLVISPRIFGDAFYNSKDIPFLVAFIFSILTLHLLLEKKNIVCIIIHCLSSAILIALRTPGVIIMGFTLGLLSLELIILRKPNWKSMIFQGGLYIILTCLFTYLFWPILWHDPFTEIQNAFQTMSHFPWRGGVVLYRGNFIESTELPWHYIPVWMVSTIPLGYLSFAFIGFIDNLRTFFQFKSNLYFQSVRDFLLIIAWLLIPIMSVILLKSVVYDAWRHLFFIYPAVIIFAVMGLKTLLNTRWGKISPTISLGFVGLLMLISIAEPLIFMVRNHPLEMVYFNQLVNKRNLRIRQYFEMEYWGLSYRQGLEYVLAANPGEQIRIKVANSPGILNAKLLSQTDRDRLVYVSKPEEADYFLTNYRYHPEDYDYPDEVFNIIIGDEKVFSVFQMGSSQQ